MASQVPVNPLTEQHFQDISTALQNLDAGQRLIDMAKQAGIPVGDAEEKAANLRGNLLKVKNTFFPGR